MPIHEHDLPANRFALQMLNHAVDILGIADAQINGLTTWRGTSSSTAMAGMIRARAVHGQYEPLREQIAQAMEAVIDLGLSTDAELGAANTIAATRVLFTDNDATLNVADRSTFAFPV